MYVGEKINNQYAWYYFADMILLSLLLLSPIIFLLLLLGDLIIILPLSDTSTDLSCYLPLYNKLSFFIIPNLPLFYCYNLLLLSFTMSKNPLYYVVLWLWLGIRSVYKDELLFDDGLLTRLNFVDGDNDPMILFDFANCDRVIE